METQLNGLYRPLELGCQGAIPKTVLRLPGMDRNPLLETRLIIRVQGEGPYSWLYTSDGKRYLVSLTLGYLTRDLSHFVRVHKSHLVNPAFALRVVVQANRRWLRLTTGEKLPLSRRVKLVNATT